MLGSVGEEMGRLARRLGIRQEVAAIADAVVPAPAIAKLPLPEPQEAAPKP